MVLSIGGTLFDPSTSESIQLGASSRFCIQLDGDLISGMSTKFPSQLLPLLVFLVIGLIYLHSSLLTSPNPKIPLSTLLSCNLFNGRWVQNSKPTKPFYDETCPFHRNSWNCLRNQREKMDLINSWKWMPKDCALDLIDPTQFLTMMRNRNIGFVGDSLNENFLVSFLCVLRVADLSAKKWKRKGAWRGAYFPKFNVTVAYHRAVLLAKYEYGIKICSLVEFLHLISLSCLILLELFELLMYLAI